jgi:phosphoribosylamine--glycine ligase
MGAYSPAPVMSAELISQTIEKIIKPTLQGMRDMGAPFKGVLYAGLMIDEDGPQLIEYNARFGDPECQVLMMRLESDLLPLLMASAKGDLAGFEAQWSDQTALTVVLASTGYPGSYEKGTRISGLDTLNNQSHHVFHAGTALKHGQLIAVGGRVLNVTALGDSVSKAQSRAYQAIDRIDWPQGFCRRDIGWRAIAREKE